MIAEVISGYTFPIEANQTQAGINIVPFADPLPITILMPIV